MERTQRDHYPKHEFYSWVWPGLMALTRCWKHSSEILVHVNMTASSSRCKPSAPPHPTALVLYQDLVALEAFGGCALNSTVFWSSTVSCCWACAPCRLSLLFLVDRNWPSPLFYLPSISVTGPSCRLEAVAVLHWPRSLTRCFLVTNVTSLGVCLFFDIFLCELKRENLKNTEILQR